MLSNGVEIRSLNNDCLYTQCGGRTFVILYLAIHILDYYNPHEFHDDLISLLELYFSAHSLVFCVHSVSRYIFLNFVIIWTDMKTVNRNLTLKPLALH